MFYQRMVQVKMKNKECKLHCKWSKCLNCQYSLPFIFSPSSNNVSLPFLSSNSPFRPSLFLLSLFSLPGCVESTWTWMKEGRVRRRRRRSSGWGRVCRCWLLPWPTARAVHGAAVEGGVDAWPSGQGWFCGMWALGWCVSCSCWLCSPWSCCLRLCSSTLVSYVTHGWAKYNSYPYYAPLIW